MITRPWSIDRLVFPADHSIAPRITGTSGTWEEVTPGGISADPDFDRGTSGEDNYGIQDICGTPLEPSIAYAFTCYQGMWRSTNFGASGSWYKYSAPGGPLDYGKNWGEACSLDGVLFATSGNNADTQTGGEGRKRVFRSYDGGITWSAPVANPGNVDPYNVAINPTNRYHLLSMSHDDDHLYESLNGGTTWVDSGQVVDGANSASLSSYVHWVTSTIALVVCQSGGGATEIGIFKCVRATSGTWTFTRVHSTASHDHGAHQICIDQANDWIYCPAEAGIYRSAYSGDLTSWTQVSSDICSAVAMTGTKLYGIRGFPDQGSGTSPKFQIANRTSGNSWALQSDPGGMGNGGKTLYAMTDGNRWVLLAGCWNEGIWRYIE